MREVDTIKSCQDKMRRTLEQVLQIYGETIFYVNCFRYSQALILEAAYFHSFLKVNHQLGSNRNARHQLERDLANKDGAIGIDHTCHQV